MSTVGKKVGPAVRGMNFHIHSGNRTRLTSCRRNLIDHIPRRGSEDDHAAASPGAAPRIRGIAEGFCAPVVHVQRLQLALAEESDAAAVWGPERIDASFCAAQDALGTVPQGAIPDFISRTKYDSAAVRREDRWYAQITFNLKRSAGRRSQAGIDCDRRCFFAKKKQARRE